MYAHVLLPGRDTTAVRLSPIMPCFPTPNPSALLDSFGHFPGRAAKRPAVKYFPPVSSLGSLLTGTLYVQSDPYLSRLFIARPLA